MLEIVVHRRKALIALFIAFAIGLGMFAGPASSPAAHAKPIEVGSDVQAVIADSRIAIDVIDWEESGIPFAGSVTGPNGFHQAWDAGTDYASVKRVFSEDDLEAGTYTITPASPIAPGWHFEAFAMIPNSGTDLANCPQQPRAAFSTVHQLTLSVQTPVVHVCVAAVRDGSLWGSRIQLKISGGTGYDWEGTMAGPTTSHPFSEFTFGGTSGVLNDIEPGQWHPYPATPIKAGYVVAGWHIQETASPSYQCPSSPGSYNNGAPTISVSATHPRWTICLRVVAGTLVGGSHIELRVTGDASPLDTYSGKLNWPTGTSQTFAEAGFAPGSLNSTIASPVPGGYYTVIPGEPISPGYKVTGFAFVSPAGAATDCPADKGAYGNANSFTISAAQPTVLGCMWLEKTNLLIGGAVWFGVHAIDGDNINDWDGTVLRPGGATSSWAQVGIAGSNYLGTIYDPLPGTYTLVPNAPVRPGWVVKGFAAFEADVAPQCPADFSNYGPTNSVALSQQHDYWMICAWVEKAPAVVPSATPSPAPTDVPQFTVTPEPVDTPVPPGGNPGGLGIPTAEPTSTPTPAAKTPPATVPAATATPSSAPAGTGSGSEGSPSRPVSESNAPGEAKPSSTPLPPNTGTSAGRHSGTVVPLALGIFFLTISGVFVAAHLLPGRPKR
ncbi:MAG: hypothetical protein AB7J35_16815 [Dehalococcoidia bacterium]